VALLVRLAESLEDDAVLVTRVTCTGESTVHAAAKLGRERPVDLAVAIAIQEALRHLGHALRY